MKTLLRLICTLAAASALSQTPGPKPNPPGPGKGPTPQPSPPKPDPGKPQPEPAKPEPAPAKPQPAATAGAEAKKPAAPQNATPSSTAPKKPTIAEVTKNCVAYNGLFRVHADRERGSMFLYIRKDQLNREFLYFSHVTDGVASAGRNRGQFNDQDALKILKRFDRLDFVVQNTAYYFDPEHPLARAARANVSNALVVSEPVVASDNDGYLINAGSLFLRENFMQVKGSGGNAAVLGRLSEQKTKFMAWGSYPRNTFFNVEYVFENPAPPRSDDDSKGVQEMADPRYVSIRVQHTLVAMPENGFQPRPDDPRIGYFMTQVTDQTSTEVTPWRDFIHRWDLRKKDPAAPLSEPVEPIAWWIENTTPREFRETIRTAALLWNTSFEKIGFKDALVIHEQPDDAKWTADDIEHNVLRWTSSPKPPFGGYGPHFVNPRTGQIMGADIMLEFSFVKNRVLARRLWSEVGLAGFAQETDKSFLDPNSCAIASLTQQSLMFGSTMMRLRQADQVDFDVMMEEAMTQLILHELGHTLGLNHNFRASHLHTPDELQNRTLTERTGLSGSVMDYMPINLGPDKAHQGQYFLNKPGPYDDWAIEYGYSTADPDPAKEKARLAAIAARSHEPQLAFANDADDMRVPGKAIDPRAQVFDMSSDPVSYGSRRCDIVRKAISKLLSEHPKEGRSWQELAQAYVSLTTEQSNALTAVSRYIGGVYVERPFVGQVKDNPPLPLRPVEAAKQRQAMRALALYAFAPDAWTAPQDLISHMQQQRRGFEFRSDGEDPKLHQRAQKIQSALLEHLMHSATQNRILDTALYGNTYTLAEMENDLTAAIITPQELGAPVNTLRQNLQAEYVGRLVNITHNNAFFAPAQGVALYQLRKIEEFLKNMQGAAPEVNKPHIAHLLYKIRRGLDEKGA
jgi:hypothetical protein